MDRARRASINILESTKYALDSIKHPGQSYDGLIQELIRFWKKGAPKTRWSAPAVKGGNISKNEREVMARNHSGGSS